MRIESPARLVTVDRDEKDARLRAFMSGVLITNVNSATRHAAGVTVVARTPDSPVARAAALFAADMAKAGIALRVIMLEIDLGSEDHTAAAGILDCASAEIRILGDIRFAAAHEQLTLSGDRVWIGDCMRRDPAKRDAFELYHSGDATAARHAEASFAKLWAAAKPAKRVRAATVSPEVIHAGQASANQANRRETRR